MIRNEDAYYTGYYRNVRELGAVPALVFDTICGLIRETGIGEIANSTLMEFLGIKSKRTLIDAINKIVEAGYIEKKNGDGRGNKCIYYITEKGVKNVPFMTEKGCRKYTKRVQILHEKGAENAPINKVLNKELKKSGGVTREAQHTPLSDTTPQIFEKGKNIMEDFNEFWSLYPDADKWQNEKENCERVWHTLQQNWRDNLLQQLRQGQMWRRRENDNPYFYLRNYNGETVRAELPFHRQGTKEFAKWMDEQEKAGNQIAIMRYGDDGKLAYCLVADVEIMEAAGAKFLTIMQRRSGE